MEIIIQGILLQTRTIDKAIRLFVTAAKMLGPLRGDASNVVDGNRVVEPSEDTSLLELLRVGILQKLNQVVPGRARGLWTLCLSKTGDDEIGVDSDIQNPCSSSLMCWKISHSFSDLAVRLVDVIVGVEFEQLEDLRSTSVKWCINDL